MMRRLAVGAVVVAGMVVGLAVPGGSSSPTTTTTVTTPTLDPGRKDETVIDSAIHALESTTTTTTLPCRRHCREQTERALVFRGMSEPPDELVEMMAETMASSCSEDRRNLVTDALQAAHDAGLIVYRDELEGVGTWLVVRASMEHGGAPIVVDAQAVNANDAVIEDMVEWPKDERR
jgi:hypothetical protein